MEDACERAGYPADAWIPGQTKPHSFAGRVLHATGQAYKWTCGSNKGPQLTREEITVACQVWAPDTQAYSWDPDFAYSWTCI